MEEASSVLCVEWLGFRTSNPKNEKVLGSNPSHGKTTKNTGWTNRNATMLQGNHSAGNLYVLSGFMVPQASARSPFGQISAVLCSLFVC